MTNHLALKTLAGALIVAARQYLDGKAQLKDVDRAIETWLLVREQDTRSSPK